MVLVISKAPIAYIRCGRLLGSPLARGQSGTATSRIPNIGALITRIGFRVHYTIILINPETQRFMLLHGRSFLLWELVVSETDPQQMRLLMA